MRKFWGFYDNGTYRVGCSGASIWVYDQHDRELARFKDIRYVYVGTFQPGTNIFAAKSTAGIMAVYDLDRMELVKKFAISRQSPQDSGCAFTPDGRLFYNIEMVDGTLSHRLAIYRSSDFEPVKSYFERDLLLYHVEFGETAEDCFLLGHRRSGQDAYSFIARFADGEVLDEKRLHLQDADCLRAWMSWKRSGFTQQKLRALQNTLTGSERFGSLAEEYQKR